MLKPRSSQGSRSICSNASGATDVIIQFRIVGKAIGMQILCIGDDKRDAACYVQVISMRLKDPAWVMSSEMGVA